MLLAIAKATFADEDQTVEENTIVFEGCSFTCGRYICGSHSM